MMPRFEDLQPIATSGGRVIVHPSYAIGGRRVSSMARLNTDGSLDPSFVPAEASGWWALASYPDGRLVVQRTVAGDIFSKSDLIRLLPNGTIDASFASAVSNPGAGFAEARILADGRILVVGFFESVNAISRRGLCVLNADGSVSQSFQSPFTGSLPRPLHAVPLASGKIAVFGVQNLGPDKLNGVIRLNADGSIDSTFNAATIPFPEMISAVYPSGDGLLVVVGASALFRVNADGSPDANFSPGYMTSPRAFGPQRSDGKIFYLLDGPDGKSELRRLNADGSTDAAFVATVPRTPSFTDTPLVVADDGACYLSLASLPERAATGFVLSRVLPNGSIDAAFHPRFDHQAGLTAFARQPDGKLIVAGTFSYTLNNGSLVPSAVQDLARLATDGSRDHSFAATLAAGERVRGLWVQPNGKVIARGSFDASGVDTYVRFNADGARDTGFRLPLAASSDVAFDASGRIYGWAMNAAGFPQLRRYTADGDRDPTFTEIPLFSPYLFAVWGDGKVAVTSAVFFWYGDSFSIVKRYLADGSLDPLYAMDSGLQAVDWSGLVALPDGHLLMIGRVSAGNAIAPAYRRFTATGVLDFQYYGKPTNSFPLSLVPEQSLEAAGVVLDLLRDARAAAGSRVRVDLPVNAVLKAIDVAVDGTLWVSATRLIRTTLAGPSVDPRPTVLSLEDLNTGPLLLGGVTTLSAAGGGLFPLSYQWLKDGVAISGATSASFKIEAATPSTAGNYTVVISNAYGSATSAPVAVSVNTVLVAPVFTTQPPSQLVLTTGSVSPGVYATGNPLPTIRWWRNGSPVPLEIYIHVLPDDGGYFFSLPAQPDQVGIYTAVATNSVGSVTSTPMLVGFSSQEKVIGVATEVGPNTLHPSGRTFDQCLLTGAAASVTADAGQVTRLSYTDLNNDIVQVEFSGAGTLTLSLLIYNPNGPVPPANYNQPEVKYMGGHAAIVIAGADETTNLSVFSVGRVTAVNQSLFRPDVTYDGVADLAFVAILSRNGKFGGLRCANANFYATRGFTGVYAPGVRFTGPVYIGDINTFGDETPMILLGSADGDTLITGGDLAQAPGRAVQVSGLTRLKFVSGTNSHGNLLPAQTNQARLEQNGVDVTAQIVVNPTP